MKIRITILFIILLAIPYPVKAGFWTGVVVGSVLSSSDSTSSPQTNSVLVITPPKGEQLFTCQLDRQFVKDICYVVMLEEEFSPLQSLKSILGREPIVTEKGYFFLVGIKHVYIYYK